VPIIVAGFTAKGIAAADIKPRENVLTFHGWLAKRSAVKKGEHGVRVPVGKGKRFYTVFHESQTEAVGKDREKKAPPAPVKTVVPVDFKPAQETPVAVTPNPKLVAVYPFPSPIPLRSTPDPDSTPANITPMPNAPAARALGWRARFAKRTNVES
jgi:hypothetical protein